MTFTETIRIAFKNVRTNVLRTVLTLMIIAFGIMALVGILTAIDTILYSMNDSFSYLGANSFSIQRKNVETGGSKNGRRSKQGSVFTYRQSQELAEKFSFPGTVSVSFGATSQATIKFKDEKTNPTVRVRGVDENYFLVSGYDLDVGRAFSPTEVENGGYKVILGTDIVDYLFDGKNEYALGKTISIGSHKFKVIGILKSKGSSMNSSSDRRVYIPLLTSKNLYGTDQSSYWITIGVQNAAQIDDAISYTTGLFRNVRRLKASEESDFEIFKSDGIISILRDITFELRLATIAIGLMTLFGAAIGLMNIMLVSVTERTKEIGVIKALGATQKNILSQFLIEAVIICQLGGITGVILGILVGNIVTYLIGGSFLMPWAWIALGLIICSIVGLLSGLYPALKAARLDPIESLRYE